MNACKLLVAQLVFGLFSSAVVGQTLDLNLQYQSPVENISGRFHRLTRVESWNPSETAVIVCDVWDSHHSVNAVRRVGELAPRIAAFTDRLREQGVTVVHAPSGCMATYAAHPARHRAQSIAISASTPDDIGVWCHQIPREESAAYPLDQSQSTEDDDPVDHQLWMQRLEAAGRKTSAPWLAQTPVIAIDAKRDYISDDGREIWNILDQKHISNVILVGVHTNMCVLGRPFGLRQMAAHEMNVVLCRDLTDTMYDPQTWPYASHFTGTDLIVDHIERYVCPTISSNQILGGVPFRFSGDRRVRLLMLIAEDEYETEQTLPEFAARHLSHHFSVQAAYGGKDPHEPILGVEQLSDADAVLISVRRRALPEEDLRLIREFVASGKPVIGIRTASHAFSLRKDSEVEPGRAVWPDFDQQVFGGNYTNHYGNGLKSSLNSVVHSQEHPILRALNGSLPTPAGSLYKAAPLESGTQVLVEGSVAGEAPQPTAWTFIRTDGGRSFYTSLGHPGDFQQAEFEALLSAGIHWACGLQPPALAEVGAQNNRYLSGGGKQRK